MSFLFAFYLYLCFHTVLQYARLAASYSSKAFFWGILSDEGTGCANYMVLEQHKVALDGKRNIEACQH